MTKEREEIKLEIWLDVSGKSASLVRYDYSTTPAKMISVAHLEIQPGESYLTEKRMFEVARILFPEKDFNLLIFSDTYCGFAPADDNWK